MPGRSQVGHERPIDRLDHAVEQHVLDPHVVVEVLQVNELLERGGGMQMDGRSTVQRERQVVRTAQGAHAQQLGDPAAARDVGLEHVDRAGLDHARGSRQRHRRTRPRRSPSRTVRGRAGAAAPRGPRRTPAPRTSSRTRRPRSVPPGRAPACASRRRWRQRTAARSARSRSAPPSRVPGSRSGSEPTFILTRGIPCSTQPLSCSARRPSE